MNLPFPRIQRWRRHAAWPFARDTVVLFAGNGAMSLLFLLFHMLMGRKMRPVDYAELVALIGLLNVLNVPAGVMQLTMARYVAEYAQGDDDATWRVLVRRGLRLVTGGGAVALVFWCLGAPWLCGVLQAPSVASVAMVGAIAFAFLYTPILGGALQGSRRFGWSALSGIGVAASRLAMAVGVVAWLHGGITAILGAVALSVVAGLLIAYWPLRGGRHERPSPQTQTPLPSLRAIHGYFWKVLVSQVALFVLIQADVILSPRYLHGDTLAAYGKAATLSRIVFFLPLPIVTAMFPRAVTSGRPRLILAPAFLTLALCVAAAAVMTLCPGLLMRLMYRVSDPLLLDLTRVYVWAAIPLALINILAPYLWARREAMRTLWLLPVTAGYLVLLGVCHDTPRQIILCLLAGGLAALLLLAWLTAAALRAGAAPQTGSPG